MRQDVGAPGEICDVKIGKSVSQLEFHFETQPRSRKVELLLFL